MRMNRWLWGLWIAMLLSMLLRQKMDPYIIVALIILPILIVILDLHEEIAILKDENKHQRKFVMERYNVLQERLNDMSNQIEKRLVVDFAEFAKTNSSTSNNSQPAYNSPDRNPVRKLKKKHRPENQRPMPIDFGHEAMRQNEGQPSVQAPTQPSVQPANPPTNPEV